MVTTRDHDPPSADDGPAGGASRELECDLDVGEPRHAVAAEERPAPPLAPDEAHGQRRAVLDFLVRPDFHIGLDDTSLADSTEIGNDYALGQERVRAHDALVPDHGFLDHGARAYLHLVPEDAALDVGARLDDGLRPDDGVGDTRAGRHLRPAADDDGAGEPRRWVHAGARIEPYRPAFRGLPPARDIHPDLALEKIQVRCPLFRQVAHVAPVALRDMPPERSPAGEERRE